MSQRFFHGQFAFARRTDSAANDAGRQELPARSSPAIEEPEASVATDCCSSARVAVAWAWLGRPNFSVLLPSLRI